MDVHQLRMFVAVAEANSIRSAAQRVYVAQPQLSKIVRRLEREVGSTLFVRSTKGVALTPAGLVLLDQARVVIRELDYTIELMRNVAGAARTIKVGLLAGQMAAGDLTAPILTAFRDSDRNLAIKTKELTFAEQLTALIDGTVDVALVRPPATDDRLQITPLVTEPRVLCLQRGHPLADAPSVHAGDILDEKMIGLAGPSRAWNDFWLLNEARGGPGRVCSTPVATVAELKFALMLEKAVMPVARSTWHLGLRDPALRVVPLTGIEPSTVAVAFRRGETRPDVLAFAHCAQTVCRRSGDAIEDPDALLTAAS
jgi:DNA-binding transcriptional LysR family regulator